MWVAVFQRNLLFVSSEGFLKMEVVVFFRAMCIPYFFYFVCLFGRSLVTVTFGLKCGQEMQGGQCLLLNINLGSMKSHINIYRN
jgi:hypothetical protein